MKTKNCAITRMRFSFPPTTNQTHDRRIIGFVWMETRARLRGNRYKPNSQTEAVLHVVEF